MQLTAVSPTKMYMSLMVHCVDFVAERLGRQQMSEALGYMDQLKPSEDDDDGTVESTDEDGDDGDV